MEAWKEVRPTISEFMQDASHQIKRLTGATNVYNGEVNKKYCKKATDSYIGDSDECIDRCADAMRNGALRAGCHITILVWDGQGHVPKQIVVKEGQKFSEEIIKLMLKSGQLLKTFRSEIAKTRHPKSLILRRLGALWEFCWVLPSEEAKAEAAAIDDDTKDAYFKSLSKYPQKPWVPRMDEKRRFVIKPGAEEKSWRAFQNTMIHNYIKYQLLCLCHA